MFPTENPSSTTPSHSPPTLGLDPTSTTPASSSTAPESPSVTPRASSTPLNPTNAGLPDNTPPLPKTPPRKSNPVNPRLASVRAMDSNSTPFKTNPSSRLVSSQTRANIYSLRFYPFLKADMKHYKSLVGFKWLISKICGITEANFDALVSTFRGANFLENDDNIRNAAIEFCNGTSEKDRYQPFCDMANRIRDIAVAMPDLAKSASSLYPISDGHWMRNDPTIIERSEERAENGADRKPDMVYLRMRHLIEEALDAKGKKVRTWVELLLFCEVKDDDKGEKGPIMSSVLQDVLHQAVARSSQTPSAPSSVSSPKLPDRSATQSRETSSLSLRGLVTTSGRRKRKNEDSNDSVTSSSAKRPRVVAADAVIQAASNALEILSNTNGSRTHCLGLILERQRLSLWLYDAAGIITTKTTISIIDEFDTFATVIFCLARCTPEQLGATPEIRPPERESYPAHFPPKTLEGFTLSLAPATDDVDDTESDADRPVTSSISPVDVDAMSAESGQVRITLGRPVFSQYSLVGRHTIVYKATASTPITNSRPVTALVVKLSQQVSTRPKESDFILRARKAGVKNLPRLHLAGDLWDLDKGIRGKVPEEDRANYENRVLRALVYTEYQSLEAFFSRSSKYLGEMVYQIINCLHDLRHKARILHRDISFNNIMVLVDGPDGRPLFILNDFDLATYVKEDGTPLAGTSSLHRTGTLPFMAWEILWDLSNIEDPASIHINTTLCAAGHRLRYDYESLLYVALWCTFKCQPAHTLKAAVAAQVSRWELGTYEDLYKNKMNLLEKPFANMHGCLPTLQFTPLFEPWRPWFEAWIDAVSLAANLASKYGTEAIPSTAYLKNPSALDHETMNDIWTRDNLMAVLRKAEPSPLPA